MFHFVDKHAMAKVTGVSPHTLKRYRLQGHLIEGIHWIRINSRCIRYNQELTQDWFSNRHDPSAHLQAIEVYLASKVGKKKIRQARVA